MPSRQNPLELQNLQSVPIFSCSGQERSPQIHPDRQKHVCQQTFKFLCPLSPCSYVHTEANTTAIGRGCGVSSLGNGVLAGRVPIRGANSTVLHSHYMRTQLGATFFLCTKRQLLPDTESASTFIILAASASRTVRNKFLLFPSHSFYGIVLQQSEQTRAVVITKRLISPRAERLRSRKNKYKRRRKNKGPQRTIAGGGGRWWQDWKWSVCQ